MSGPFIRLAARIARPGLTRRTVRMRLTLLYGALFVASGAGLLAITYALVSAAGPVPVANTSPVSITDQGSRPIPQTQGKQFQQALAEQHATEMHQLLVRSGIALIIMAAVSILLGWIVAGRMLRPLRSMTLATRTISADSLHQRLAFTGPRDELTDLADTIDGLLARLNDAFTAHRSFAANTSHELRTPLTLTRALLQMRLHDPNSTVDDFRATCSDVLAATGQQERIIEALLTLARSQQGLDDRELLDLTAITGDVVDDLGHAAANRHVTLDLTTQPAPIQGDADLIQRLVTNLVENAIRYNYSNGTVHIHVHQDHAHPTLEVTNTGPIVPPDDVPRLLQPFHRATPSRIGDNDGLGLGLSIVKAITVAHAATMQAQSRSGGGLHITITFPPPPHRPPHRPPPHWSTGAESSSQCR